MKSFINRASAVSYKVGLILSLLHLLISWWVIIRLASAEPDAQWQLIWFYFLPFDLPFSLLVYFSGSIFADWSFYMFPYPISEFRSFILPSIIHGIIGPLWYFFIPICFSRLRIYFKENK